MARMTRWLTDCPVPTRQSSGYTCSNNKGFLPVGYTDGSQIVLSQLVNLVVIHVQTTRGFYR